MRTDGHQDRGQDRDRGRIGRHRTRPGLWPRLGAGVVLLLAVGAVGGLGGCSYASGLYVFRDITGDYGTEGRRLIESCNRIRTNMTSATDPVEARRWALVLEDMNCPTVPESLVNDSL